MRLLIFALVAIILLPVFIVGFFVFLYRVRRISIPQNISGTANEPYVGRLYLHVAGTRPDPVAYALAGHLPVYSRLVKFAFIDSIRLPLWISGYRGGMFSYPGSRPSNMYNIMSHRTAFFDDAVREALTRPDNPARQFVVLGTGFDTRCYDLPQGAQARCFEVDMAPTLKAKQHAVEAAGVPHDHVTFVETDFDQRSWMEALLEAGFDPKLTTFILWEGVTMYLNEQAVMDTLNAVNTLPSGSAIAFDYFSKQLIDCEPPLEKMGKRAVQGIKFYGETLSYGIDTSKPARDKVAQIASACGLEVEAFEHTNEEKPPAVPIYCFTTAVKP